MKHFLDIKDLTPKDIMALLNDAKWQKQHPISDDMADQTLVLVFEKESTRTRLSFEIGMQQLGGHSVTLNAETSHLNKSKETVSDTSHVLSRYADILMYRTWGHQKLIEMAENSFIPVINGLTNHSHPCQFMADLLTILENKGSIEGLKVAWIGDANNVARSWLQATKKLSFSFHIASPKNFGFSAEEVEQDGTQVFQTTCPEEAIDQADVVLTDTWISMGDEDQTAERRLILSNYQVNEALMSKAKPDAIFMHCLPAQRGEEVSADVIDGTQSVVFDEAENRLHIQKSILLWCLEKELHSL